MPIIVRIGNADICSTRHRLTLPPCGRVGYPAYPKLGRGAQGSRASRTSLAFRENRRHHRRSGEAHRRPQGRPYNHLEDRWLTFPTSPSRRAAGSRRNRRKTPVTVRLLRSRAVTTRHRLPLRSITRRQPLRPLRSFPRSPAGRADVEAVGLDLGAVSAQHRVIDLRRHCLDQQDYRRNNVHHYFMTAR